MRWATGPRAGRLGDAVDPGTAWDKGIPTPSDKKLEVIASLLLEHYEVPTGYNVHRLLVGNDVVLAAYGRGALASEIAQLVAADRGWTSHRERRLEALRKENEG